MTTPIPPKFPVEIVLNINEPAYHIAHKDLERYDDRSAFRSVCPVCEKGILLVRRDASTMQLEEDDYCTHCAQHIIYSDIDELRENDPTN